VELDRQVIERRDFPIVRRGYDPASVDVHLRALAADIEELQREASSRGHESLASTAGTHVQGILEAAQTTAETIEREAAEDAQRVRNAANEDARRTREEAVARAQEHVAAVSQATEVLLARVGSMDRETQSLVESLRSGASRLAGDLAAVETDMGALYDAAAGRIGGVEGVEEPAASYNGADHAPVVAATVESHEEPFAEQLSGSHEGMQGDPYAPAVHGEAHPAERQGSQPSKLANEHEPFQPRSAHLTEEPFESRSAHLAEQSAESRPAHLAEPAPAASEDLDGARLVALNMALNGDSREETGRYLAENFEVPDRERLLDEVYAAVEG
jgi:DivIVA domain-containing protein